MDEPTRIRVLSVDDHPLLREGLAAIIESQADMTLVSQASNGAEAIQMHRKYRPDVTLMDLRLPDLSGIDAMLAIRAESPDARIIILTTFEGDVEIRRALQAGAHGYLLKSTPPNELVQAIRQVHAGKKRVPPNVAAQLAEHMGSESLSTREVEVLRQVAYGNQEIHHPGGGRGHSSEAAFRNADSLVRLKRALRSRLVVNGLHYELSRQRVAFKRWYRTILRWSGATR